MWRFMFLTGLWWWFVWCSGRSEERSPERNVHHCVCKAARSLWCDPIHTSLLIHKVNLCFPCKVVLTGHISSSQHPDTIYKLAVLSGFYFVLYLALSHAKMQSVSGWNMCFQETQGGTRGTVQWWMNWWLPHHVQDTVCNLVLYVNSLLNNAYFLLM